MSNPTLTKKQQKRSIAGIQKKKLKTVLTQPYQIFWPIISSAETKELQNILHKIFDKFTTNGEIRKKSVPANLRKIFNFGMNSSIRSVRNKTATALLISDEINPKFIARQVITLAISRNENIKILVVPEFKEIFKNNFKISPTMFTVTENTSNNSTELQVWINKTAKNYPVPATMLLRLRKYTIPKDCKPPVSSVEKPKIEIDFNKLYLFRESTSERKFIPSKTNDGSNEKSSSFLHIINVDEADDDDDEDVEMHEVDYIAFQSEEKTEAVEQNANKKKRKLVMKHPSTVSSATYIPLKVNKIQPNPNKKKKSKKIKLNKLSI